MPRRDLTTLLALVLAGDAPANDELWRRVEPELRALARRRLARERDGGRLHTTELLSEVFLKVDPRRGAGFENRRHFFRAAARAMRQVLVDHARKRRRGEPLDVEMAIEDDGQPLDVEALDVALRELEARPQHAHWVELIELRVFGELSAERAAAVMGVSLATSKRSWRAARCWLRNRMRQADRA